ncbi:MAG TPA: hypothetical protein IGS52_12835 [Oscillatoriaceae cyanobacterium M33_DOE_052]|uniref:Uncharacterized protein n=1 Tax=Planktothricoides sp. SpSt-374 TaxID=2282167 RepID=A0A7C3VQU1_9CYAN|nr:hypothetical protein [Oscillatoriaceae cyanobacterium M33_DOE_052]
MNLEGIEKALWGLVWRRSRPFLLGFLLCVFFGYLRSQSIDGAEKSYMIPTIASYIAPYLAVYIAASSIGRKQKPKQ